MEKRIMRVVTKAYTQVKYAMGILFDSDKPTAETEMTFILDPLMDLVDGGRIHSLAAFFIDEFGIKTIPSHYKENMELICRKNTLDGMTPYDIVWMSIKVRGFYEQGNSFPSVYKAYKSEDRRFDDVIQFLKDAR